MYSKDYILRMMQMIAELLAVLLRLIKKGDLQKASELLNKAFMEVLKKDAAYFLGIPSGNLLNVLLDEHQFTSDHIKILSDLFYAEGELHLAKANPQLAHDLFDRSLLLLDFVEQTNATFSLANQQRRQVLQLHLEKLRN